jgi:Zn-dependent protease with chaperone function
VKKIFIKITALVLIMIFVNKNYVSASGYVLQSWDLVDSGKHLDWDGTTNYMTEWYNAVNTWNAYKPGVIRADRWNTIEDVHIYDKDKCDGSTFAVTLSSGKIYFYHDTMDLMTSTQRQATITHELGHALGLDHNKIADSIMKQGYKNYTILSNVDTQGYDAAYKKY